jgi:hypothetical protein
LFTGGKAFAIRQPFNEDNSHIYYHSLTADHSSTCGVYFTSDCHSTGLNVDFGARKAVGVGLGARKVGSARLAGARKVMLGCHGAGLGTRKGYSVQFHE